MNLLQFIRYIADSDEEFLAIIKEMNSWCEDEKSSRSIYTINNTGRFNFTKDEYKKAIDTASQAFRSGKADKHHREHHPKNRASEDAGDTIVFW